MMVPLPPKQSLFSLDNSSAPNNLQPGQFPPGTVPNFLVREVARMVIVMGWNCPRGNILWVVQGRGKGSHEWHLSGGGCQVKISDSLQYTFNMPTINRKITHDYWWTILAFSTSGQLIAIWWAANGPEKKRKIHCIICFR